LSCAAAPQLGKELGTGAFAVVHEVTRKKDGLLFAAKICDTSTFIEAELDSLMKEIDILRRMEHPSIMTVEDVFQEGSNFIIVSELLRGGELVDRLIKKKYFEEVGAGRVQRRVSSGCVTVCCCTD
jgi:serine/threonine protein kinase